MKNYKIKILMLMLILGLTVFMPKNSYAGIQANKGGTSLVNTTASDFFSLIRTMEGTYGTLGVSPDNSSTSTYNGIDAHMAKNTEWGTAAMLAVSSYGSNSNNTTTGNSSGIYNMADGKTEYTSNYIKGTTQEFASNITNAVVKYRNEYESSETRMFGDALNLGTIGWEWTVENPVVARGWGSLFKYTGGSYITNYGYIGGRAGFAGSRACVVMGSGL